MRSLSFWREAGAGGIDATRALVLRAGTVFHDYVWNRRTRALWMPWAMIALKICAVVAVFLYLGMAALLYFPKNLIISDSLTFPLSVITDESEETLSRKLRTHSPLEIHTTRGGRSLLRSTFTGTIVRRYIKKISRLKTLQTTHNHLIASRVR